MTRYGSDMIRRLVIAAAALGLAIPAVVAAADVEPHWIEVNGADVTSPEARLDYYRTAQRNWPGRTTADTWTIALHLANANGERTLVDADQLVAGQHLSYLPARIPGVQPSTSTTSSVPPTVATTAPATTTPATTSTTTATSTSTPTTVGTTSTTTLPPQPSSGFLEDFNGNPNAMDRFRWGVHHRDDDITNSTQWQADHALLAAGDCTPPTQTHTVHVSQPEAAVFVCSSVSGNPAAGHMMTTMGDVSGYSFVWFAPDRSFSTERVISFDVGLTNEGQRRWWEVAIVPVTAGDLFCAHNLNNQGGLPCGYPDQMRVLGPHLTMGGPIPNYPTEAVVFGSGPLGNEAAVVTNGVHRNLPGGYICGFDPEGCNSIPIRRPISIVENADGTITFTIGSQSWNVTDQFPSGQWKVVFSEHNYTPDKDGPIQSHTFHWDNISIR